jgi:predicted  nucleic acid-binding Zn-ribbon protein
VASLQNGKVALEGEVKKLTDKVSELTTKRTGMEQTIGMFNRLEQRGFDEKALDELERSSKKYGAPKAVLEAINQHAELTELQQKISDLSRKKSDLQSEIKKLEADNTQLMTVIAMSRTLLFDYNFSPSAISDIYELAKKYGQPFEVLKAIGSYGGLEAIETETGILSAERDELKNKLTELDVRVKGVKNTWDLIQVSIVDALNSLSTQVTDLPKAMAKSFQEGIEAIQTKTLETGKAWGEVEQKIKASKRIEIILDLIERPTELKTEFNRVNDLSLAFVKGLQTYLELNKDRIRDSYKLEEKIRGLSEVLTERATSGA